MEERRFKRYAQPRGRHDNTWQRNRNLPRRTYSNTSHQYKNPFHNKKPANCMLELIWTQTSPSISYAFNPANRKASKSPIRQRGGNHSKSSRVEEKRDKQYDAVDDRVSASISTTNLSDTKTYDGFANTKPQKSASEDDKLWKNTDKHQMSSNHLKEMRKQEKNKLKQKTAKEETDNAASEMSSRHDDSLDWDLDESNNENVNNTLLCTAVSEFLRGTISVPDAAPSCNEIASSAIKKSNTTTISTSTTAMPTCASKPVTKTAEELPVIKEQLDKIQQLSPERTVTPVPKLQQQDKAEATTKSLQLFNDFDVLSINEIRAEEAEEQHQKQEQLEMPTKAKTFLASPTVPFDENESSIMELLPNVSKDFKKLKTLENNLQRIQKMRISLGDIDDICDDLIKMEKLLQQEKNLILQKYAKSDSDLLATSINLLPKAAAKKLKKSNKLTAETASNTTNETNESKNLLKSNTEIIKLTISPIKLTPKLFKRTTVPKLFADDDDELDDNMKETKVSTATVKTVAIVKPIMESKHTPNKHTTQSEISENEVDTRRSPSRSRSRRRSNTRNSTPRPEDSYARHYQRSHSRSSSISRSDSQQRSSTRNYRRNDYFRAPRSSSRGRSSPVGAGSVSPCWSPSPQRSFSDRRVRSQQSHDSHRIFNYRSPPSSSSPLPPDRRHNSRSPCSSRSPQPHENRRSHNSPSSPSPHHSSSNSRSWTPEQPMEKQRSDLNEYKHKSQLPSYENNSRDIRYKQETQYYGNDHIAQYDNIPSTSNDTYYYNTAPHLQIISVETLPPLPILPRTTKYNYHNQPEAPYVPPDFLNKRMPVVNGMDVNVMVPPPVIWPVDISQPPPNFFPAAPIIQQNAVLDAVPKQQTVAIQKGNVLEIVLEQTAETDLASESRTNHKENLHGNKHMSEDVNTVASTVPVSTTASTLPAKMTKKSINMKWIEEVEQRRMQANLLSQNRVKQSILKSNKGSNKTELPEQQQKQSKKLKKKKKVFFVDGIYPNHDSSEEDIKAVVESLKGKVQRLRKRYGDEQVEQARVLVAKLEMEKLSAEMDKLPPPPPPPGLPPSHLEQPIYLGTEAPDDYQYFHYDNAVHSMYVSSYEHALPPRLLSAKKKSTSSRKNSSASSGNLMKTSTTQNQNLTRQNAIAPSLPAVGPTMSTGVCMPQQPIKSSTFNTLPPRTNERLPTHCSTASTASVLPNEFVTQPLYPISKGRDPRLRNPLPFFQLPPPTHIAPMQKKLPANVNPVAAVPATVRNNMRMTTSHYSENII